MPTGKSGIGFGSGKPDYAVNAIYSGDFGAWHTDINLLRGAAWPGGSGRVADRVAVRRLAVAPARRPLGRGG